MAPIATTTPAIAQRVPAVTAGPTTAAGPTAVTSCPPRGSWGSCWGCGQGQVADGAAPSWSRAMPLSDECCKPFGDTPIYANGLSPTTGGSPVPAPHPALVSCALARPCGWGFRVLRGLGVPLSTMSPFQLRVPCQLWQLKLSQCHHVTGCLCRSPVPACPCPCRRQRVWPARTPTARGRPRVTPTPSQGLRPQVSPGATVPAGGGQAWVPAKHRVVPGRGPGWGC